MKTATIPGLWIAKIAIFYLPRQIVPIVIIQEWQQIVTIALIPRISRVAKTAICAFRQKILSHVFLVRI
jgi:hypothetical protein